MQEKTVIFMGPQGSGKGTQSELLKKYLEEHSSAFDTKLFESGQYFRDLREEENYTGDRVFDLIRGGNMAPDFIAVWMWTEAFKTEVKGSEHILIDGFPRTMRQVELLDDTLKFYNRNDVVVINLVISDEVATERLLARGRNDDTKDGIKKRLTWYKEEVSPIFEYYGGHEGYRLVEINGEDEIQDIHENIIKALEL